MNTVATRLSSRLAAARGPVATAHCINYSAKCTFTFTPAEPENVKADCDLVVYTMPNPTGPGLWVNGHGHKCP